MTKVLCDDFGGGDTGIGRYYREIIKRKPEYIELKQLNVKHPSKISMALYPLFLHRNIKKYRPDVFWSPGHIPPAFVKCPFVMTVHDLIQLKFYPKIYKHYYNYVIKPFIKKADKIITDSLASEKDIIEWLPCCEHKIVVIPCGVSKFFFEPAAAYKSDKPYFLYVGNRHDYKNINRALTAFSRLQNDCQFYLSGVTDLAIEKDIVNLGIKDRVKFAGRLNDEELRALYKGAVALVMVSLAEGFGLPNVEALACGTNVITSNISSMPEVVGDQGILVDPYSIDAIYNGMRKAFLQYECDNVTLREDRVRRARLFNWEEAAKKTWETVMSVTLK